MTLDDRPAEMGPEDMANPPAAGGEETRIGYHAHDVSRMRRTLYDQAMKPLGLTRSQWWALQTLARAQEEQGGEGILQTDLARRLEVGKVTVGGLADRLEAAGFVERRMDAGDRRAKRLNVTPRGEEVLERMRELSARLNAGILEGIPAEEVALALSVLERMKGNLRRMLDERE
ncbi:MAG: MarR family winged helix-turn-helix transcriptional regulator [Pseudomonadota bacterium]